MDKTNATKNFIYQSVFNLADPTSRDFVDPLFTRLWVLMFFADIWHHENPPKKTKKRAAKINLPCGHIDFCNSYFRIFYAVILLTVLIHRSYHKRLQHLRS